MKVIVNAKNIADFDLVCDEGCGWKGNLQRVWIEYLIFNNSVEIICNHNQVEVDWVRRE